MCHSSSTGRNEQPSHGFNVTGYVLLLYDYFLTLPEEVKLIWPTPWSLVKALFLIVSSRYLQLYVGSLIFVYSRIDIPFLYS